jgi:hypothetical protein
MKRRIRKIRLNRETVRHLDPNVALVEGGISTRCATGISCEDGTCSCTTACGSLRAASCDIC